MTVCDRCQAMGKTRLGEHARIGLVQDNMPDEYCFIDLCPACRDELLAMIEGFKCPVPDPPVEIQK